MCLKFRSCASRQQLCSYIVTESHVRIIVLNVCLTNDISLIPLLVNKIDYRAAIHKYFVSMFTSDSKDVLAGAMMSLSMAAGGGEGGIRPGRHCEGGDILGSKIWISEIWPLLANWRLHCTQ